VVEGEEMSNTGQKVTIQLLPGSTLLTIVFVLLKAFDKIDWSWWWVFAPIWLPIAFIFGIILLLGILAGIANMFD
jgi:hypothetical protein